MIEIYIDELDQYVDGTSSIVKSIMSDGMLGLTLKEMNELIYILSNGKIQIKLDIDTATATQAEIIECYADYINDVWITVV